MTIYHCCVPECRASSRKTGQLNKYPWMKGVTFLPLPNKVKEPRRRREWIRMIRREASWCPNKYTRVCSLHFAEDSTTPTLFPYNNFKQIVGQKQTKNSVRAFTASEEKAQDSDTTALNLPVTQLDSSFPYVTGEIEVLTAEKKSAFEKATEKLSEFTGTSTPSPSVDHVYCTSHNEHRQGMTDATTQTEMSFEDIYHIEEERNNMKETLGDKKSLFRDLFVEKVLKSDETVKLYTGLPSISILVGIFNILMSKCQSLKYWSGSQSANEKSYQSGQRAKPGPSRKLSPFQEFVLTVVRLRLGLLEFFEADIFGVSKSRISQIFTTWITFMSSVFGKLIKWPSKSKVRKHMPASFKRRYPKTRAIIDCTEFFFQRPRSPTAQAATYSSYKSKNTGKCLLAISPSGTFTFVSDIYGGNVSDRFITQNSGFLDLVEEGDDIMADRGFTVRDLLTQRKATLNMPPFTRKCSWGKKKRLNVSEIRSTRKIASLRIHVERAIQRLKMFRMLSTIIPWHLKPLLNQMVKVSAFLCNLMPKLVRK